MYIIKAKYKTNFKLVFKLIKNEGDANVENN